MILLSTSLPPDFFTKASFATLAGATGIVLVICGTIQSIFNYNPKWLALLISILVSFAAATFTNDIDTVAGDKGPDTWKYFFALLNGFLIYSSATGANQVLGRNQPGNPPPAPNPANAPNSSPKRTFLARWW